MSCISKSLALILIAVMAISILSVFTIAHAQTLSAPVFELKVGDGSYLVPGESSTDPYTGVTTTSQGYYVPTKVRSTVDVNSSKTTSG